MSEGDRDRLADWLLSTKGRLARIAGGTILILFGLGVIGGLIGVLLLLIGAVPIASAAFGALVVGPLLGRDTMGRKPEDQPEEEKAEDGDDTADDDDAPEADPDWSAPPLARAERRDGQRPRTRDLRAEEPAGTEEG